RVVTTADGRGRAGHGCAVGARAALTGRDAVAVIAVVAVRPVRDRGVRDRAGRGVALVEGTLVRVVDRDRRARHAFTAAVAGVAGSARIGARASRGRRPRRVHAGAVRARAGRLIAVVRRGVAADGRTRVGVALLRRAVAAERAVLRREGV